MLYFLLPLLYIIYYWNAVDPPLRDIISPLITLTLALEVALLYPLTPLSFLVILNLLVDSLADYIMDQQNLSFPILLFSVGHILKQYIFTYIFSQSAPILVLLITHLCEADLCILVLKAKMGTTYIISFYAGIIGFTFLYICIAQGAIHWGYVLFIISDIIIALELLGRKLHPPRLRVLLVPLLYWAAEIYITYQAMNTFH